MNIKSVVENNFQLYLLYAEAEFKVLNLHLFDEIVDKLLAFEDRNNEEIFRVALLAAELSLQLEIKGYTEKLIKRA